MRPILWWNGLRSAYEVELDLVGSNERNLQNMMYLRELLEEYEEINEQRRAIKRSRIILESEAPICINCGYCQHEGVYFVCLFYRWPEDGKIVGLNGIVYYYRRGKGGTDFIKKTYDNVPMKPSDCEEYTQLIPKSILKQFVDSGMI